jgi:pimeloyl-ACP methyl ester carboxylesterase
MASTYRLQGATVIEREHIVPLVHQAPDGRSITVFSRELIGEGGEARPYLAYFQGGPGHEATRPTSPLSGWMKRAVRDYRVLLFDQRGTGRSTPVGVNLPGNSPQEQAEYLTHFRADAIVRDAELVRQELGIERWSILGQSFGGFISMAYLSMAPDGLRESMITGGLSPIGFQADEIYRATYKRVIAKNEQYFERYRDDRRRVKDMLARLDAEEVRLPNGDRLTSRRFRQLGAWLGDSAGFENLHHLIELPMDSNAFLADATVGALRFARNPIYATLHESSYADGVSTRWSAARMLPPEIAENGYFTGEHVFPWMFDDYGWLRPHRDAADILAAHEWPKLYDEHQLRANEVPVAAAVYVNDMYVEFAYSMETAAVIRGLKPWVTNEYEHNGIRADGERVLGRLIDMVRGNA